MIAVDEISAIPFSGKKLFDLKARHGFPIEMALDKLINEYGMAVNWPEFIEYARDNGWWDFQTFKVISHGLEDAGVNKDMRDGIIKRFQLYVLKYPHPKMTEH